ncbi:MAG: oligopeptide:H+ symporter [Kofleriaceae bacterium]
MRYPPAADEVPSPDPEWRALSDAPSTSLTTPARTLMGHPLGLWSVFVTELWERFSYYGMRALLVLFLVDQTGHGGLGMTDATAVTIYGLYTAGVYIMAMPGGWLADRLLGARRAVLWGAAAISLGHVLLALGTTTPRFMLGLAVIVLGTGLLKPNIAVLVGQLYPQGGAGRTATPASRSSTGPSMSAPCSARCSPGGSPCASAGTWGSWPPPWAWRSGCSPS